ncbi:MAG: type III-B CRISPR module RAMP protein Cmr4 [Kiritimatiellae bacterium]|nr:type III-B CRISPR module RAMP protein Cmr4 [Kiritimatiellia bacterium]
MQTKLLSIFTRTPLHVGAGASVGAVDQPVVRERHTRFPVIPGSSLKGVLADLWLDDTDNGKKLFGTVEKAGALLVGESKLLAFPVRSARNGFAWITCPTVLNRFSRDTGKPVSVPSFGKDGTNRVYPAEALLLDGRAVVLEEYPLAVAGPLPDGLAETLSSLSDDAVWKELPDKLAVVSDELFQYFAENACEIAQHNRIDDESGTVADGALFNQENVPSETMFYCVVNAKDASATAALVKKLSDENNLIQIGADATTGLGWCSVKLA